MLFRHSILVGALALETLVVIPAIASAQDYGVTATVERPFPAGSSEDPTLSATTVDLEERTIAAEEVTDVIAEIPGGRTQRTGGFGSFSGLSIRGAELDHTVVVLDDVPLENASGASFDLSLLPLSLLERVDVYRGGAPWVFATSGVGGLLRLVPREARGSSVEGTVAGGSFGLLNPRFAAAVDPARGPRWMTAVGFRHSDGDYPYTDDNGTPLLPDDDVTRRRQNAHIDEGHGLARLTFDAGPGELNITMLSALRTGGLTGSPVEEPTQTRRHEAHLFSSLSYRQDFGDWERDPHPSRLTAVLSAAYQRNRLSDRFAEISVAPRSTDDHSTSIYARFSGEHRALDWLDLGMVGAYRLSRFEPNDRFATQAPDPSTRHLGTIGGSLRVHTLGPPRFEMRVEGFLERARSALSEIREGREGESTLSREWAPSGRVGCALEPHRGIGISASVSTATRLPTPIELFGERGFLLGDTELEPERSISVDGGITLQGRKGRWSGLLDARAYGLFVSDLIRYVRTAQFRLVPQNVADARLWGLEVGLRGEIRDRFAITGALTYQHTLDETEERELPLRPRLRGHLRPTIQLGPFGRAAGRIRLFVEITHVSSNFTDPRNQVVIAARTLFSAGVAAEALDQRLLVSAIARDLTDERPFDLVGFPLPGRQFFVEVTVRTGELQ